MRVETGPCGEAVGHVLVEQDLGSRGGQTGKQYGHLFLVEFGHSEERCSERAWASLEH